MKLTKETNVYWISREGLELREWDRMHDIVAYLKQKYGPIPNPTHRVLEFITGARIPRAHS